MGKPKNYVPLPERELCPRGHVIADVGVYDHGDRFRCRACHINTTRKSQTRDTHPRAQLPFDAIDGLIRHDMVLKMPSNLQRAYYRSRRQGYAGIDVADQLATFIGHHPSTIWGWDFYTGCEEKL